MESAKVTPFTKELKQAQKGKQQMWIPHTLCPKKTLVSQSKKPSKISIATKKRKAHNVKPRPKPPLQQPTTSKPQEKRWIPKATLNKQGYYKDTTKIWISKLHKPLLLPPTQAKVPSSKAQLTGRQEWRPKQPPKPMETQESPTPTPQIPKKVTQQEKGSGYPR